MSALLRLASPADAGAIADSYRPYVESTAVSFELVAPSTAEMAERIRQTTRQFPWLVLDAAGSLVGYAYATRHRERPAYGWSVDTSVYVTDRYRRRGAARALYTALLRLLTAQGYFKAYAGITLPNDASVAFHEGFGFTRVGVYNGVGYKLGAWHDVARYQVALQAERPAPDPPHPVSAMVDSPAWREALAAGLQQYRQ